MFEPKERIGEAVEAVYYLTRGLDRGDMLTHDAVRAALGVGPHEGCWDVVIRKVLRRLEDERGISHWPNTRDGYKLCTVDEQIALIPERARRGRRNLRKGLRSGMALRDDVMSPNQRRLRFLLLDSANRVTESLDEAIREQTQAIRPTPTIPRRPPPEE